MKRPIPLNHASHLNLWLCLNTANKKSTTQRKGFALAAVMFILLITAIIAATAVKTGLLNENLAQTQNQIENAKQNAELTVRDGMDHVLCAFTNNGNGNSTTPIVQNNLFTGVDPFTVPAGQCQNGICGENPPNTPLWQTLHENTPTIGFARYGQFTRSDLINANLGRYLIEAVQTSFAHGNGQNSGQVSAQEHQYRITAVGFADTNPRVYQKIQVLMRPIDAQCSYDARKNIFGTAS
jgi:Tfp pilus assembly protein PilX